MNISRPACIGSTVEASKVRKNRKNFAFKKFILPHCLDSATLPRPNERDPNSRVLKMHRKEEKKRRGKADFMFYFLFIIFCLFIFVNENSDYRYTVSGWTANVPCHKKTCLRGFSTRKHSNWPAQINRLALVLKFWL